MGSISCRQIWGPGEGRALPPWQAQEGYVLRDERSWESSQLPGRERHINYPVPLASGHLGLGALLQTWVHSARSPYHLSLHPASPEPASGPSQNVGKKQDQASTMISWCLDPSDVHCLCLGIVSEGLRYRDMPSMPRVSKRFL